jgi:excisionase family DNA binding protein
MMEKLLTIKELAEALRIEKGTLYVWTCKRRIPFCKVGHTIRFKWSEIEEWMIRQPNELALKQPRRQRPKRRKANGKDSYIDSLVESVKAEILR